jgi:uroporphyrinogen III methyltransferase/synthase
MNRDGTPALRPHPSEINSGRSGRFGGEAGAAPDRGTAPGSSGNSGREATIQPASARPPRAHSLWAAMWVLGSRIQVRVPACLGTVGTVGTDSMPSRPGKVYLLGAGPGDPELITLRARRRLAEADLVLYDALVHPDLLLHCRPEAERAFVGKRAGRRSERQAEINRRMVEAAREGRTVARLKGGDPYLFGRGSEEAEHLAAAGIAFEVVPGVPSPLAATAYAGMSLSHRELASSIAWVTATESEQKDQSAHDWAKLATATQTLVIFMGVRKLESLMQLLLTHGRPADCPAAVIQSASLPQQRTVLGTVATIAQRAHDAGIGMPALTVVGEVVRLREHLRWYDSKPLFGKRVLVTRAADQAASMAQALRDAAAEPVLAPAIRIASPANEAALHNAVAEVGSYAWLVLTSRNGVDAFFGELRRQGADARRLGGVRVAAIGPATAACLREHGIEPDAMPDEYRAEAVAEVILARHAGDMRGASVLLVQAEVARDALPDKLKKAGARVEQVPAYRTLPPLAAERARLRETLERGEMDVVTFTSASTVDNTVAALGTGAALVLARVTVASIGPITTEAAERHGLHVAITASESTVEGLVTALETHFKEKR